MDNILAEFASNDQTTPNRWNLYVNRASFMKRSGVGIILKGPSNVTSELALKFNFKASNNKAKYKAIIVGLKLARVVKAKKLRCFTDS